MSDDMCINVAVIIVVALLALVVLRGYTPN